MSLLVLVLAVLACGILIAGCGKGAGAGATVTTGVAAGGKPAKLENEVGSPATVGDVTVLVSVLMLSASPAYPQYPIQSGLGRALLEGETFCQAFVRIENNGDGTVAVNPRDFSAMVGNVAAAMDEARTGPVARTLLHGTSLELILTYVVPEESRPELVYHPPWLNGTMVFKGEQKPLGAS